MSRLVALFVILALIFDISICDSLRLGRLRRRPIDEDDDRDDRDSYSDRRRNRHNDVDEYRFRERERDDFEDERDVEDIRNAANAGEKGDQDLVQALLRLVERGKKQDTAISNTIKEEEKQEQALKLDLVRRQEALAKHSSAIQRLQQCLKYGPQPQSSGVAPLILAEESSHATCDCGKLDAQLKGQMSLLEQTHQKHQSETFTLRQALGVAQKEKKVIEQQMMAQNDAIKKAETELENFQKRENELKLLQTTLLQRENLVHRKEESLSHSQQQHLLLARQLAEDKSRLESQKVDILNALHTAKRVMGGGSGASSDFNAARFEQIGLSLQRNRLMASDNNGAPIIKEGEAGNNNNGADGIVVGCSQYKDCQSCTADASCGWCSAVAQNAVGINGRKGTATCIIHDVNAKFRGFSDGLTSGICPNANWQSTVTSRITALTLNVFASDTRNKEERFRLISNLIQSTDPTFIALQEVDEWFLELLQASNWIGRYYQSTKTRHAPGGLLLLSKYPYSQVTLFEATSINNEDAIKHLILVAQVNIDGQTLSVVNLCLDWKESRNRVLTMDYLFSVLTQFPHVLLLGDFNFDDQSQPETSHLSSEYVDVWPALRPKQPGFTWDPVSNAYAHFSDPKSSPSRIDRIFVKSTHWLPRQAMIVGCSVDLLCREHIANADLNAPNALNKIALLEKEASTHKENSNDDDSQLHFPSNHYGVFVHLSRFSPHC